MLEPAVLHVENLVPLYVKHIIQRKNMYYNFDSYIDFDLHIEADQRNKIQYVSVSKCREILGYVEARVNRYTCNVETLLMISFEERPCFPAIQDALIFLDTLFLTHGFRKIVFHAIIDNPAVNLYTGYLVQTIKIARLVGFQKNHVKLNNGEYYDLNIYEILREDYEAYRNKKLMGISSVRA